jgi:hypothetical protein
MSQPIVLELQDLASDSSNDLGDLLRKALLVASKLKLDEFRQWLNFELGGYPDALSVPAYRVVVGDLRAHNPINGLVPLIFSDKAFAALMKRRSLTESIGAMEYSVNDGGKNEIAYGFPPETEARLMQLQSNPFPMKPLLVVGRNQLAAILGSVRTNVLTWALTLEAEGIVGDGLSFSEKERGIANSRHVHINNFQGVFGNVSHGGQVQQNNSMTVVEAGLSSLMSHLGENGIAQADLDDLKAAISADPKPTTSTALGPRVSRWVGKMLSKAADGTWELGIATAGTLLANALARFYGL